MSATATSEADAPVRMSREKMAEHLTEVLTAEPQPMAAIRRTVMGNGSRSKGGRSDVVRSALEVLKAQGRARYIERQGWVIHESPHESAVPQPQQIEFPYQPRMIRLAEMFVDRDYQRPLTQFADEIRRKFDPFLFQTLALSDRGSRAKKGNRYALMDGQTRWHAASELGVIEAPALVYTGLSIAQEADLFARFQSERKGVVSYYKFRARLVSGDKEAIAIKELVDSVGYKLGAGPGELRSLAALTACYRGDEFLLERTLSDLRMAWPSEIPDAQQIKGLHYFFRKYPIATNPTKKDVDDEKLVRRLSTAGPSGLARKVLAAREMMEGKKHAPATVIAMAIESIYSARG